MNAGRKEAGAVLAINLASMAMMGPVAAKVIRKWGHSVASHIGK